MDEWRIKRIPYDQFGDWQYHRAYGWGWLSPIGVVLSFSATAAILFNVNIMEHDYLVGTIYIGFIIIILSIFGNSYSERKSMLLIDAKCIDVQVKYVMRSMDRNSNWVVRAVLEYEHDGSMYRSTPMPNGYVILCNKESAEQFARHLMDVESVKIYVDPKRPKRSLFVDIGDVIKASKPSTSSEPEKTMSGLKLSYLIITYLAGLTAAPAK